MSGTNAAKKLQEKFAKLGSPPAPTDVVGNLDRADPAVRADDGARTASQPWFYGRSVLGPVHVIRPASKMMARLARGVNLVVLVRNDGGHPSNDSKCRRRSSRDPRSRVRINRGEGRRRAARRAARAQLCSPASIPPPASPDLAV